MCHCSLLPLTETLWTRVDTNYSEDHLRSHITQEICYQALVTLVRPYGVREESRICHPIVLLGCPLSKQQSSKNE
jgi:hypothetical protein